MPGGIAPLTMAWQRRMGGLPGPLSASGEASNGEPVTVELFINGTWVDITTGGYVMVRDDSGQIAITRGIRDEGSQTDHATASLQLRNTDGRFSPRNPTGPYYGLIGRNTPCRISVPDGMGGKNYRIWGEIADWAQDWERSGNDVWTNVSVNGPLRRLAQGPPPARSVIYNAITDPLLSQVVAYWPCEDASGATSLASALTNGSRMTWTGTPTLASYEGFAASDPLPDLTTATLSGGVARYDDPTATQVRFLAHIPADGLSDGKVLCAIDQTDTGTAQFWELYYSTTTRSLVLRQHNVDGSMLGAELPHDLDVRGRMLYVSVELRENGASCDRAIRLTDVTNRTVYSVTDTAAATSLTRVTKLQFGPASRSVVSPVGSQYLPGVAVGHITVETTITATDALGVRVNPIGETAGRRIQRLCGEEAIPFDGIGSLDDTVALGAQGKQNPLSLMQEAVTADGGMLFENPLVLGLGYRTRASLHNQDPALVLDYAGYNLAQVPTPVEDDQRIQNKVTVTVNGVSQTYEETDGALSTELPPAGIGAYGSDLTLNLADSDTATLLDQAAWRVHLGTVDEERYPRISVNLAHSSITPAMRRAVLALRMGDRVQILNPPSWLPPDTIDQLVLGMEETLTRFEHRLTFICAPASPYTVGVLDSTLAAGDTDGSELYAAVTSSATQLDVVPSAGETGLWSTAGADAPWNVRVGGEVMTVTGCSSKVADSFTRTESNGWGTAGSGQAWTLIQGSASERSVNGTRGVVTMSSSLSTLRIQTVADNITDAEVFVKISPAQVSTGNSFVPGVIVRYHNTAAFYRVRLHFRTDSTVYIVVTNVSTEIGAQVDLGLTYVANDTFVVRARVDDHRVRARAWRDGDQEPPDWHIDRTITENTVNSGSIGLSSSALGGITNPTLTANYDEFYLLSPQTMFVTRSVNGVVKAHTAGTDVRLATPTTIAL